MEEKIRKPKIRFKGFTDTWEQRKLLEVANYRNGKAHENDIDENGKYVVVNSKFVSTDGNIKKFSNKQNEPLMENEIAFVLSDVPNGKAIAKTYLVEKSGKYTLNQRIAGITAHDNINPKYLSITMNRNAYFLKFDDGAKQTNLSLNDMIKYENFYPEKDEQDKIGMLFTNLDNLITLHQCKYDKLVNVKKSLLEKMFPKNGSNVPKIRFKGFTDTWEQRKLGECFEERKESMPDGELISVTINDGIKKFSELNRHDNSNEDKTKYKKVCVGDIAYNSMRMWQGASGYSPYEGIVSPAYTVLSPNDDIVDSKCISYLFKREDLIHIFQINSQGITSDNWNLKYPALSEIEIKISNSIAEQKKIAKCFSKLDTLITLHQRKLEKLQNIKKSLLDKMFV